MKHKKLLLSLLEKCPNLKNLKKIHAHATTLGLLQNHNQALSCKILTTYANLNNPDDANRTFNQIQRPDIVSWTCLIKLFVQYEDPFKSVLAFSQLIRNGLRPDTYSVVAALSACGKNKDLDNGKLIHGVVSKYELGFENPIVGNALIDMYSRNGDILASELVFEWMFVKDIASWNSLLNGFLLCNDLEASRRVFDKMPSRNAVSWTAMISGYVKGKEPLVGLKLFKEMKSEGKVDPTMVTIVAVLAGCADSGGLYFGVSVHGYVKKVNLNEKNVVLSNALMDMYSKCGYLDVTAKIFNDMVVRDVFSWTTMITGYAFHGKGKQALELFFDMLESRVAPNEVTFLSALSACSHEGLLVQGQRLFRIMVQRYGFKPKIEHYGCVLDLLGRAGLLEEAKMFIEEMPILPDAVVWRSLLCACLVHGKLDLAEVAGKKVIELEPDDDGAYLLLWHMYSSTNRPEGAVKIRKLMRNQKVRKRPGCSWLEVNGIVREFLAEYRPHYAGSDSCCILEGISEQSKLNEEFLWGRGGEEGFAKDFHKQTCSLSVRSPYIFCFCSEELAQRIMRKTCPLPAADEQSLVNSRLRLIDGRDN
ncbi:Tetratricopeptide repeat-like superfamily protein, putative isoform 3 [Theobroma cacao]|uniref:Tetratricopeptide repeat-like superfamily protein, putative isoform 3 n=1 Tax=Theobroma cacao TaxID=3641 RepID=A0A061EYI6_THECC|nr:Tetratricopeptide repeat-like superfamily protein, putative isoform 3 [Theobroma cacao]